MIRRLLNLIATISLLLGFAAIVFWIRSYSNEEAICYGNVDEPMYYQLTSDRGLLAYEWIDLSAMPNEMQVEYLRGLWTYSLPWHPVSAGWVKYYTAGTVSAQWIFITADGPRALGATGPGSKQFRGPPGHAVAVPYWTVAGLLLLLPIGRLATLAQQRRQRAEGLCPKCGEALDETDRCPRCDAEPA